jgi:hypothetical protein
MTSPERAPVKKVDDKSSETGLFELLYYLDLLFGVFALGVAAVGFLASGIVNGKAEDILFGGLGASAAVLCWFIAKGLKAAIDGK